MTVRTSVLELLSYPKQAGTASINLSNADTSLPGSVISDLLWSHLRRGLLGLRYRLGSDFLGRRGLGRRSFRRFHSLLRG